MTGKQAIYLILSIAGIVGTWYFNLQMEDLSDFFVFAWDTPLSSSMLVDLLVVCITFFVFMWPEGRRLGMHPLLLGALLIFTGMIAVAFTFPLFMFFRERALAKRA